MVTRQGLPLRQTTYIGCLVCENLPDMNTLVMVPVASQFNACLGFMWYDIALQYLSATFLAFDPVHCANYSITCVASAATSCVAFIFWINISITVRIACVNFYVVKGEWTNTEISRHVHNLRSDAC
jgi:hypothetical protein